jgi:hypothetical protein
VPADGVGFATFNNNTPGTSYYYTNPIQMNTGITYSAAIHYATEYFGHANWTNLTIMVGPNQSSVGMVPVASVGPVISGPYKLLSNTFTVATAGQYYVAIRATSTAGSAQYLMIDKMSITIPCEEGSANTPVVTTNASSNFICANDIISINASGADTYSWSTGSTGPSVSESPGNGTAGIYTITVWGNSALTGCSGMAQEVFTVNPSPDVFVVANNPVVCSGQSAVLSAYGALSYAWSNNQTGNPITVNPSANASYTVIGVNSFGCSSSGVVSIAVNPKPALTVLTNMPGTACKDDVITLSAAGASTYLWASNATSQLYQGSSINISSPATAVFTVTGTDSKGCTNTATILQDITDCTGITKQSALAAMSIFPNPTTGEVNVIFNSSAEKTLNLTDLTGRVILSQNVSDDKVTLDISAFSNGIYYLRVSSNDASETLKIVKN